MRAILRIFGNESQPGLQLVEKLATPLMCINFSAKDMHENIAALIFFTERLHINKVFILILPILYV